MIKIASTVLAAVAAATMLAAFVTTIPSGPSDHATAQTVAADVLQAARDERAAIVQARIDGMRPPLPVLHIYDADEEDDLCASDKPCAGFPGYRSK